MNAGSRAVTAWLTLAGVGFLAAFVVMSQRYLAATPRWDLIGCFAVAAVGVTGCLVTVRKRKFTDFSGVGPRPWWPDLRAVWRGSFTPAWLMVLIYFVAGLINISPTALQMVERGHVIAPVEVSDVLSSERERGSRGERYYSVRVRAAVPYAAGDASRTAEFDSQRRVRQGDDVWVLYAPSTPELGAFIEEDRDELEEKAGGPESGVPYIILTIFSALLVGALVYTAPGLPRHMRRALREGRVRRLPVRVTGGTATLAESASAKDPDTSGRKHEPELKPAPCLLLSGPVSEHIEVVVGKSIDPVGVVKALEDRQDHSPAALYWIASGEDEGRGVLLSGNYYLRCRQVVGEDRDAVPTGGDSIRQVSEARRRPREVRRFPEWRADLHTDGFGWTLFILLLLGVIALGVGLIASIVLGVIAFVAGLVVLYVPSTERSEELEKLMPGSRREEPGHDAEDRSLPPEGEGQR